MSGGDPIPILCTLARHHTGDHDEHAVPGRKPCGALVRYYEPEPEEQVPAVEPVGLAHALLPCGPEDIGPVIEHDTRALVPAEPTPPACSPDCLCRSAPGDRGCAVCHPDRYKDREGYVPCAAHVASPPPLRAPEPPPLADLVAAVMLSEVDVCAASRAATSAADFHASQLQRLALDLSAVAHRIGRGQLVAIGGALFRSVQPRKPKGGDVPEGALWSLVAVEVAK